MHVIKECNLHVEETIEKNKTLRVIKISDNILTKDKKVKKRRSQVNENNIVYENIDLGAILKFISKSNHNINFIFAEGISCKQEVNITIEKYEDLEIKEVTKYLNSIGIYVELVEKHPIYTVKKIE